MKKLSDIKIVIVGATGLVGQEFLKILKERNVPSKNISLIASSKSVNKTVDYCGDLLKIEDIDEFDFSKVQIGLFSPGAKVSEIYAPIAAKQGCFVIDNTSFFRMHENIPLIVPEVNFEDIYKYSSKIISNPNCSTIQLVMALKAIQNLSKIKRVVVSTYQSVSGAGKQAIDELINDDVNFNEAVFKKGIKYNLIPQIDIFLEGGVTKEEWKMMVETNKILNSKINVSATCVRVPVVVGHSESVNFELEDNIDINLIYKELQSFKGIIVDDPNKNDYITPVEVAGKDEVFISRLRYDRSVENGYQMWVVSDNLRKGAALNAIQIAEKLVEEGVVV